MTSHVVFKAHSTESWKSLQSNYQLSTSTSIPPIVKTPLSPKTNPKPPTMPLETNTKSNQDTGVTGAAKFVTSTVGNTVGGVGRTAGNVVGAASRGLGDTITSATGSAGKPVGDALGSVGTGVQSGAEGVSKGVENAGQWKR
ncbi:uncharacterized protein F4822DRAFT_430384 [Hypoxylon trugodes]|uniref:uncharacterized protein n=1 Tax=Hypoxylon trugodes TaxID=326681 RepID=UPI0021968393|nr:uncharacterized protein F4822DRAFT_430384 [Hypoxylon trugodes]KAI1387637.1 hypothetical protein F4822DRAFT_430384 [Hypoxylon trugodes]